MKQEAPQTRRSRAGIPAVHSGERVKPRIAQVANFVGPHSGGMRTAVDALGARYAASGAQRLLVTPGVRDAVVETSAGTHVQLRALEVSGGYRMILEPWRVLAVLSDFAPTSIEVSDKTTMLPVARWARRAGAGCVLFSHERLDAMMALRVGIRSARNAGISTAISTAHRLLTRGFDAIVVTSRYAAGEFPATARTRLRHIPLGVDLELFHPRRGRPASDVLRLVHAGRLSREKSPDLAVATAVELHRRGIPVRMDVYGQGPLLDTLRRLAADAPVSFHGHVGGRRELAAALASADVALSVCPGETFGLSILEALASGTPVVTADRGGGRELVTEASGAWAPPEPPALADAVLRLASRDARTARIAARRQAERFDWSATAGAMLHLHREVAAGLAQVAAP
ncbi:MAG: glycosyltransferase [Actinophytocola sp.]|nr:glycosyltransferase [Actinophytocola sp.]